MGNGSIFESGFPAIDALNLVRISGDISSFGEEFIAMKTRYDSLDEGLTLESPTLNRIRSSKYHMPFDEAINTASRDANKVMSVLR